ncbi:CAAX prenyl protease-like protein [Labedella gwakjiensis]|nr:CPBP family glutamic-type intramembrane protease [Labedella gwakjiensis]PSL38916.1 CAAX prenyl protease-like protein [Labedella gwakjiensis]
MPTTHRWSLTVPVVGVLIAVAVLPVASLPSVPAALRESLSYAVVWLPLSAAVALSVRGATKGRVEPWWRVLRLPISVAGVVAGLFVGLTARSLGLLLEVLTTGRIGTGSAILSGGAVGVVAGIAIVIASIVVAPVLEELFFRGTLQPAVGERLGLGLWRELVTVLVVAATFAAVHAVAGAGLLAALVTFIAGVGFGLVARSYRVGAAIVAHMVFNASGLAIALSATGLSPVYPTLALG